MNASPGRGARPSTVIGPHAIIWLNGSDETPPTADTPGSADTRAQMSRYVSRTAVPSPYFCPVIVSSSVRTLDGLNPGGTCCRRTKLRTSSPAPTTSITDSASSPTTSARRRPWPRPQPAEAPEPRAASLSASWTAT